MHEQSALVSICNLTWAWWQSLKNPKGTCTHTNTTSLQCIRPYQLILPFPERLLLLREFRILPSLERWFLEGLFDWLFRRLPDCWCVSETASKWVVVEDTLAGILEVVVKVTLSGVTVVVY